MSTESLRARLEALVSSDSQAAVDDVHWHAVSDLRLALDVIEAAKLYADTDPTDQASFSLRVARFSMMRAALDAFEVAP